MSEIDRRWIVANLTLAIVFVPAGLLEYVLGKWLGGDSGETPSATVLYAASTLLAVAGNLLYAWLTGRVLRKIAPALPWRPWVALHLMIGLILGLSFGPPSTGEPEPLNWRDQGLLFIPFALVAAAVGGALVGAVSGSLQALVLRRAAEGTGKWIAFSALATALTFPMLVTAIFLTDGTALVEGAIQGAAGITTMMSAFVMLPALRRLRPRTA